MRKKCLNVGGHEDELDKDGNHCCRYCGERVRFNPHTREWEPVK